MPRVSAKQRFSDDLRAKFADKPPEPAKPAAAPDPKAPVPATPPDLKATPDPKAPEAKKNPWEIVKEQKAKVTEYEARITELEKGRLTPEKQAEITQKEKRLQELEEEMRYTDYTKSDEFKVQYQQPFEKAWAEALQELDQYTIPNNDGTDRPANVNDLQRLLGLPTKQAYAEAEQMFGAGGGNAVMDYVRDIKNLWKKQTTAVDEMKAKGTERDKQRQEQHQAQTREVTEHITSTWHKANQEALSHERYGQYFKPVEGDQEGNQKLAKGYEQADRAFAESPMAPGLTKDQRQSIIERHAAVRNRSAAFGRLVHQNVTATARITALEAELATYKGSEPNRQPNAPQKQAEAPKRGMDRIREGLAKIAKPA